MLAAPQAQAQTYIAADSVLVPSGLSRGDTFRLLFLSSTRRVLSSSAIGDYNTFVQNRAANGHADIRAFSSEFKAVGSTAAVNARDNTATTYSTADKGVPIYWVKGNKIADDYEDFYDGSWDDQSNNKTESGTAGANTAHSENNPGTGSKHNGTEAIFSGDSRALGASSVRVAKPKGNNSGDGPLSSSNVISSANYRPIYGLSPVLTVGLPSTDASLSALSLAETQGGSVIPITPPFSPTRAGYTALVEHRVSLITVMSAASDDAAIVEYLNLYDNSITDRNTSRDGLQILLAVGRNTVKVKVTAEDGSTAIYTVLVYRAVAPTNGEWSPSGPSAPAPAQALVTSMNSWVIRTTNAYLAQRFRTGTHEHGYQITSIGILLRGESASQQATVVLRRDNASQLPGAVVATFTPPLSFVGGTNVFTSPDDHGTTVSANTYYWVSVHEGLGNNRKFVGTTGRDDQAGEAGWRIDNDSKKRSTENKGWTTTPESRTLGMAIWGNATVVQPIDATLTFARVPEHHFGSSDVVNVTLTVPGWQLNAQFWPSDPDDIFAVSGGTLERTFIAMCDPISGNCLRPSRTRRNNQFLHTVVHASIRPSGREDVIVTAGVSADGSALPCEQDHPACIVATIPWAPSRQPHTSTDPLTARFTDTPGAHDGGTPFTLRLALSERISNTAADVRDDALTVTGATVSDASAVDDATDLWEFTLTPSGDGAITVELPANGTCGTPGVLCTGDGRAVSSPLLLAIPKLQTTRTASGPAPLTARFANVPAEHDGKTPFTVEIVFSEVPVGMNNQAIQAEVEVSGARLKGMRRVNLDKARRIVRVHPNSGSGDIVLSLPPTLDCAEAGALCTAEGGRLKTGVSTQIQGPPTLSIADAEVEEDANAPLVFKVTLSRASGNTVTVDFETRDGTAVAGEDYVAKSKTFTFLPGETLKRPHIRIIDDAHDEGAETMTLVLSNAVGARIARGTATGTIHNSDAMPAAWLARFGRTVAEQVVDAVEGRLRVPPRAGVEAVLAGQRIGLGSGAAGEAAAERAGEEEAQAGLAALSDWLRGEDEAERARRASVRTVTARELLSGSSFAVSAQSGSGGQVSLWGRGAATRFAGRAGDLSLNGEVESAMLGTDWTGGSGAGAWTAGLLVSHARGEGEYRGANSGEVQSDLTGLYPYGRYAVSERVTLWGVAGYGAGSLTLTPEGQDGIETDIDLLMGAAGLRGVLVPAQAAGGPELAAVSDALGVRTTSAAVRGNAEAGTGNLAAATGEVTRLRLGLEGTWRGLALGSGALTPRLEVGVRRDGGDAETGFGLDLGGGLRWSDRESGISLEVSGRGLLTHEAGGFRDRGLAVSLAWDPRPDSDRGFSLSLRQSVGASATGGMDALLNRGTLAGLAANDDGDELGRRRLEARLGYGLPAFGDRFTATPELGLGHTEASRDYSLGWRLGFARGRSGTGSLEMKLEATRREAANDDAAEHGIGFRVTARW